MPKSEKGERKIPKSKKSASGALVYKEEGGVERLTKGTHQVPTYPVQNRHSQPVKKCPS